MTAVKPDIDRALLATDVGAWLAENRLSTRTASAAAEGINPAMISRACTGQVLSAQSLLALCRAIGRDPMRYLVMVPLLRNQAVTATGTRETREVRP
ncbi:hypothetical protein [Shinella sp. BYT-45]|uniref:hypothetical protein n=1 Tax=Shinella sp. BYT-45 TaxID=3377377 RepID=UPI00397EA1A2